MKLTISEIQEIHLDILSEVLGICRRHNIKACMAYGSVLGVVRHKGPIPWDDDVDLVVRRCEMARFIDAAREELNNKYFVDYHDTNGGYFLTFPRIGLKGYSTSNFYFDVFGIVGCPNGTERRSKFLRNLYIWRQLHYYKNIPLRYFRGESLKNQLRAVSFKLILTPIPRATIIRRFELLCEAYPVDGSACITNPSGPYGAKEVLSSGYYCNLVSATYCDLRVEIPRDHDAYLKHFYNDFMRYPQNHKELQARHKTLLPLT